MIVLSARAPVGRDDDSHQTVLEEKKQKIIYYCEHQGSLTLSFLYIKQF